MTTTQIICITRRPHRPWWLAVTFKSIEACERYHRRLKAVGGESRWIRSEQRCTAAALAESPK